MDTILPLSTPRVPIGETTAPRAAPAALPPSPASIRGPRHLGGCMFDRLPSPAELEEQVLALWAERDVFARSLAAAADREPFVFFEGPPTANGLPHNGHVLTRVVKDVIPRFQTMRGRKVVRKAGWDTHGLPVEIEVQKRLGLKGREGILELGMEAFNRACRDSVFQYVEEWNTLTRQIGFWVDLDDPYVTFHRDYVESVWWALGTLYEKGLLYQGHKVVWWWPQGGTTLSAAEVGLGYKTVDDPAVTVRFRDADEPGRSYLAWTTTPWTLPSNVALAVGTDITYAECDDPEGGTVIVAEELASAYDLEVRRTFPGTELVGRRYEPLYDFGPPEGGEAFVVVTGEHVTTSAGTGIVHTAPAFGEDDMKVAQDHDLGLLQWIEPDGTFGAGPWEGVFCKEADKDIIRDLKERGLLFRRDQIRHEYPFSYRADDEPLIQYARPAWFIRTTAALDGLLANNQAIDWTPEHIRDGRFGDFLRNNVDWALSRERFWGTPLNLWTCEACDTVRAPRSTAELRAWGATGFAEDVDEHLQIHRPWIDQVTLPCAECGGTMHRVPEVIDCWFDSGCMPFAQWGFPHKGQERFAEQFPADWISEAIDQTRGWFYSLLAISTLLFDDETLAEHGIEPVGFPRPYRSCVVLGHVTDMEGRKESKSKGNYTSPNLVLRGTTRLFVIADDTLERGTVGLKKDQVRSLELGKKDRVLLSSEASGEGRSLPARVVAAEVGPKDTCHVHPDDLAELGLEDRIWFTLPGEPPGADAFRWLFCAANPAWSSTRLSMRNIREVQREFLIRLRNVYQFFGIYADIAHGAGTFDPSGAPPRPVEARADLDRWIVHALGETAAAMTARLEAHDIYAAARELLGFVDELSNWYVRRSRARFWGEGDDLQDALWTLYEVLRGTARLLAPFVPFTAEALWQQLAVGIRPGAPDSVHLTAWPDGSDQPRVPDLAGDMALVRQLASLGLAARTASKVKVRQPLQAITVVLADPSREAAVTRLGELLRDELNVREIRFAEDAARFVQYTVKPDYKKLGRKLGKDMKACARGLAAMDGAAAKAALDAGTLAVDLGDGRTLELGPDEVVVQVQAQGAFEAASAPEAVVVLHTDLTDDLLAEGFVRELTSKVQGLRKREDLGYTQRIHVAIDGSERTRDAVSRFGETLSHETLARELVVGPAEGDGWATEAHEVEGEAVTVAIRPVG
jgi:isoleucyl-tRNA synthetase